MCIIVSLVETNEPPQLNETLPNWKKNPFLHLSMKGGVAFFFISQQAISAWAKWVFQISITSS